MHPFRDQGYIVSEMNCFNDRRLSKGNFLLNKINVLKNRIRVYTLGGRYESIKR